MVVATPVDGPVSVTWALAVKRLQTLGSWRWQIRKGPQIDVARERLVADTINKDWDFTHYLFLDSDVVPQAPDSIQRLMQWSLPIISGVYWSKKNCPSAWNLTEDNDLEAVEEFEGPNPCQVDISGMGFTLVDRRVFEKMDRPWFEWKCDRETLGEDYRFDGEDANFLLKARKYGFHNYVDSTVKCGHIIGQSSLMYKPSGEIEKCL